MTTVELVYDGDCPNVERARTHLLEAFAHAKVLPRWSEHLAADPATPAHARGYGSPTILVDGRDVAGVEPGTEPCCRVYTDVDGRLAGVPSVDTIAAALRRSSASREPVGRKPGWRGSLALVPAIGSALLPKVACPACWPAYAGFLGAVGLGFLMDVRWLLPLTAAFLALAVGALAWRARSRRGYRPLALGIVAASVVLLGKFSFDSDLAMYVGLGTLVASSLWNSWPGRRQTTCPKCATSG
jgi:hypothetical protein